MLYELAELADGSILISFGAPGASTKNADVKVPVRLPSRYSKRFPYTAKRTTKPVTDAAPVTSVNNVPVKTLPARIPSTFSRTSPINKPSNRHVTKGTEETEPRTLAFKDVQVEEDYKQTSPLLKVHISRPPTAFVRKSPIPSGAGRKKEVAKTEEEADKGESVTSPPVSSVVHPIRPKTAFARMSPIPRVHGSRRRRSKAKTLEQGTAELTLGEAVISDNDVSCVSAVQLQEREHHRPATSFIRRSPVPKSSSGSRRQRASLQKLEAQATQTNTEAQVNSSTTEVNKSRNSRLVAAFSKKSPITQRKGVGRRKRRVSLIIEEEDKAGQGPANITTAKKVLKQATDTMTTEKASEAATDTTKVFKQATDTMITEKVLEPATDTTEKPPKLKASRPKGNFLRKSPITQGKRSRRRRASDVNEGSSNEGGLSEDEIVRIVLDAAKATVKEPTVAPDAFDMNSMHAEVAVEHRAEALESSRITATQASTDVETDVEFSDDESLASNASMDESVLSNLTLRRLKCIAKSRGLKGYSKLRKAELVELLKQQSL